MIWQFIVSTIKTMIKAIVMFILWFIALVICGAWVTYIICIYVDFCIFCCDVGAVGEEMKDTLFATGNLTESGSYIMW